jgi:hypothetical protein
MFAMPTFEVRDLCKCALFRVQLVAASEIKPIFVIHAQEKLPNQLVPQKPHLE